jgi:hypothetical protein
MEKTEIDTIMACKAKIVMLTDQNSGCVHWAAALVSAQESINATLHAHDGSLIIRVIKTGNLSKIRHGQELINFQTRLRTRRIIRAKKAGTFKPMSGAA